MSEVAGTFGGRNRLEAAPAEPREGVDGAGRAFAQVRLQLGVDVLDGVEIGRIGRQIAQPEAKSLPTFPRRS